MPRPAIPQMATWGWLIESHTKMADFYCSNKHVLSPQDPNSEKYIKNFPEHHHLWTSDEFKMYVAFCLVYGCFVSLFACVMHTRSVTWTHLWQICLIFELQETCSPHSLVCWLTVKNKEKERTCPGYLCRFACVKAPPPCPALSLAVAHRCSHYQSEHLS